MTVEKGDFVYQSKKIDLPEYDKINDDSIKDITTRILKEIEPVIKKYPEQWLWFHKVWSGIYTSKIKRSWREYLL